MSEFVAFQLATSIGTRSLIDNGRRRANAFPDDMEDEVSLSCVNDPIFLPVATVNTFLLNEYSYI